MNRIILAPDSFKGTMSSMQICNLMENAIRKHLPEAEVRKIPVADGGEGTVECFLAAMGGKRVNVKVNGPYFEEMEAFYAILPDGNTAVVEMAAAAGLPLVGDRKDPSQTTTYGVGQLIKDAVLKDCRNIIIGLGGSSTNDGGCGMAAALGCKFYDGDGREFIPAGGSLDRIKRIDLSGRLKELDGCTITAMCDVDNPLYGPNGAARIFGPQKGADEKMVEVLDSKLRYFGDILKQQLDADLSELPGAGAAGGMGAGVMVFLGAKLERGIEAVLDTVGFDTLLDKADLVFTGEGKIDGQSLRGKVVLGVARRAKKKGVPVIAVVGDIGDDIEAVYEEGVTSVVSINRVAVPFEKARLRCESDLFLTMDNIMRLLRLSSGEH